MKQHWKILLWMVAGVLVGGAFQAFLEAPPDEGLGVEVARDGVRVVTAHDPAAKAGLAPGDLLRAVILHKGRKDLERRVPLRSPEDLDGAVASMAIGSVLWFEVAAGAETSGPGGAGVRPEAGAQAGTRLVPVTVAMAADSPRRQWIAPFDFAARIFMALLKMLIVPLVLTSIISGVAGVGTAGDLKRLGAKTFAYYIATSLLAIVVGLTLVNLIRPGAGAQLGLPYEKFGPGGTESLWDVFLRMVPSNLFEALRNNGAMLQIIFFGLLFGFAITQAPQPHKGRIQSFFESAFEVMMRLAEFVLRLIPYGVFCLLVRVVGATGFGLFRPLALHMVTVTLGLAIHGLIVLPLILRLLARIRPGRWARVMSPALLTAFSASSSSMTLPVTLECVEKRGGVSNKVSSFVLPLGATINMDGTALYECAGVIFLAQYYGSVGATALTFSQQILIVFLALLASIGAAGIPSAGLVMMLTILSALHLPLEGAALLLAVDRPLDMMRTVVNVWSDSCGTAAIARSEGEDPAPD